MLVKPGYGKNITEIPQNASTSLTKPIELQQQQPQLPKIQINSESLQETLTKQQTSAPTSQFSTPLHPRPSFLTTKPADNLNQSNDEKFNQSIQSTYLRSVLSYDIPNEAPKETSLYRSSLITVEHLRKDVLHKLFNLAHDLKLLVSNEKDLTSLLRGKVVAEMFFEPSTRTQCSFTAAVQRLGGSVIYMDQQHSSVKKGETLEDSVRMMSAYSDLIVIRHPEPGAAELASKVASVPLVNAGDGTGEHPTQALLDIFTIREEIGTVNGITVTMVGDLKHGRTVHSLAKLLKLYRVTIRYVSPDFLRMPADIVESLKKSGVHQEEFESLEDALADTDVLYMTRIQKERFESQEQYQKASGMYVLTPQLMRKAKKRWL